MNAFLDEQFHRLETALNTLIDSITSYNPSPAAALDLVAADEGLSYGLDQLAVHQANYSRILSLRQVAEALDGQVKLTLQLLADTRSELLDASLTAFPESSRDVPVDELLAYATHISKYTKSSRATAAPQLPDVRHNNIKNNNNNAINNNKNNNNAYADHHPAPENRAISTRDPATPPPSATDAKVDSNSCGYESRGLSSLTAEEKKLLQPNANFTFVPWPNEDVIRSGGLAQVQTMIERGKDPSTVLSYEEQEAERKMLAEIEATKIDRDLKDQDTRRKQQVLHQTVPAYEKLQEQAPAVFGGLDIEDE